MRERIPLKTALHNEIPQILELADEIGINLDQQAQAVLDLPSPRTTRVSFSIKPANVKYEGSEID